MSDKFGQSCDKVVQRYYSGEVRNAYITVRHILLESVEFYGRYDKIHFGVFFSIHSAVVLPPPVTATHPHASFHIPADLRAVKSTTFNFLLAVLLSVKGKTRLHHILTPSTPAVPNCCCWKGPAPYWSNPPFLIFDIRALWRSVLSARAPECQKLKIAAQTSMAKCKALTGSAVKGLDKLLIPYTNTITTALDRLGHIKRKSG